MWFKPVTDDGRWTTDDRSKKAIVRRPSSIVLLPVLALLALLGALYIPWIKDAWAVNSLSATAAMRCGGGTYPTTDAKPDATLSKREQVAWLKAVEARCDGLDEEAIASMRDALSVSDTRLSMARTFYPHESGLARFATQRYPARAEAYLWLGDALAESSDAQGAIEQYKRGLELAPTDANAWMALAALYQERGDSQLAVDAYDQACIYIDDTKNGCRWAGKLYLKMGQNEKAAERFYTAIKQLGDIWAPLERDLVAALLAQGKTEEAIPHLEILAKRGSEDAREKLNQIRNK